MAERKHITELALNFFSDGTAFRSVVHSPLNGSIVSPIYR
jgi:hypothetical protein